MPHAGSEQQALLPESPVSRPAPGQASACRGWGRQPFAVPLALTLGGTVLYAVLAMSLIPSFSEGAVRLARGNRIFRELAPPSQSASYVLAGVWERFDTIWYTEIARVGYQEPAAVVFYPLYPLVIRLLSSLGVGMVASAVLATRVATVFFLWGLFELFRSHLGDAGSRRMLVLTLAWPGSFILFGGYPESLVGAFAAWALVWGTRGRWWLASLLLMGAGLTKAVGAAVLPALAVMARPHWRKAALPLLAGSVSLAAFPAWLYASGRLMPSAAYGRYWRTFPAPPWETVSAVAGSLAGGADWLLIANAAGLVLLAAAAAWKRFRPEFSVYVAACYLLFLTKQTRPLLQSSLRYLIAAFPVFASATACLRPAWAYGAVLLVFALFHLVGLYAFWNWGLVF